MLHKSVVRTFNNPTAAGEAIDEAIKYALSELQRQQEWHPAMLVGVETTLLNPQAVAVTVLAQEHGAGR